MTQHHKPASAASQRPSRPSATDTAHAQELKRLHGWLHTARFLTTAAQLHHLPGYYDMRNHIVDFLVTRAKAH